MRYSRSGKWDCEKRTSCSRLNFLLQFNINYDAPLFINQVMIGSNLNKTFPDPLEIVYSSSTATIIIVVSVVFVVVLCTVVVCVAVVTIILLTKRYTQQRYGKDNPNETVAELEHRNLVYELPNSSKSLQFSILIQFKPGNVIVNR